MLQALIIATVGFVSATYVRVPSQLVLAAPQQSFKAPSASGSSLISHFTYLNPFLTLIYLGLPMIQQQQQLQKRDLKFAGLYCILYFIRRLHLTIQCRDT